MDDPRLDALFRDLEAQAAALERAELLGRADDLAWSERAGVTVRDRIRAQSGAQLRCVLRDGSVLEGMVGGLGTDWFALGTREAGGRYALVAISAVASFDGLGQRADTVAGVLEERLTFSVALRTVARDRAPVRVLTGGGPVTGVLSGVGADHLDVRLAPTAERAPLSARGITIPLGSLLALLVG